MKEFWRKRKEKEYRIVVLRWPLKKSNTLQSYITDYMTIKSYFDYIFITIVYRCQKTAFIFL